MSELIATAMRELYSRYVASTPVDGALGEVADLLASGELSHESFDRIAEADDVGRSARFRDGLLDLMLHCIRTALADHTLTTDEWALIRELTVIFRVREGEFYHRRHDAVADILQREVHRLLEDDVVDITEALYQEELQRIFGLGYDQYLELTRPAFSWVVARAIASIGHGAPFSEREQERFDRRIAALRTVYVLSHAERKALGLS